MYGYVLDLEPVLSDVIWIATTLRPRDDVIAPGRAVALASFRTSGSVLALTCHPTAQEP